MNILELRILQGIEDNNLDKHITRLEYIKAGKDGGCGISEREEETLKILYQRLEEITKPCS